MALDAVTLMGISGALPGVPDGIDPKRIIGAPGKTIGGAPRLFLRLITVLEPYHNPR